MADKCVQVRVVGFVQGVGYRYSCQARANRLGVRGWVRNNHDSSVSGHFEGDAQAVSDLIDWCRQGPRGANVTNVAVQDAQAEGHTRFSVTG